MGGGGVATPGQQAQQNDVGLRQLVAEGAQDGQHPAGAQNGGGGGVGEAAQGGVGASQLLAAGGGAAASTLHRNVVAGIVALRTGGGDDGSKVTAVCVGGVPPLPRASAPAMLDTLAQMRGTSSSPPLALHPSGSASPTIGPLPQQQQ